jgi:hypothetical protein
MNIYQLKAIIKGLEVTNLPGDKYLIEFYRNLYQEQIKQIADQVTKELDQDQDNFYKSRNWIEYLAK